MERAVVKSFDDLSALLKKDYFSLNPLEEKDVVEVGGVLYYYMSGSYVVKEDEDKKEIEAETASEGEKK